MTDKIKVTVLGAGSFGTVLANIAAQNNYESTLWMRSEKQFEDISESGMNSRYLPRYKLEESLQLSLDIEDAVKDADLLVMAIPSKAFRVVFDSVSKMIKPGCFLLSVTKGIEHPHFNLMSQILKELAPEHEVGVLSGPNLAKEIAQGQMSATVVASESSELRHLVHDVLGSSTFRVYSNPDIYGVELAGALKNCYAIATGMASALGMGENTLAMIMTRSLAEMSRFAVKMGANPLTFIGLAGMGDLIVTCSSALSRNYRVGYAIGQGYTLKQAVKQLGEVAEGVNTLKVVKTKADELDVYMPLVGALYDIIYNGAEVDSVASRLMLGEKAYDVEFLASNT